MLARKSQATASATKPSTSKSCQMISERRRVVEQSRSVNVRRIQQELQRIAGREIAFAQSLITDFFPLKISLNEVALNQWREIDMEGEEKEDDVDSESQGDSDGDGKYSPDAPM